MTEFAIDDEYVRNVFLELVNIPSPSYNETEIRNFLTTELTVLGVNWFEDDAGQRTGYDYGNIICSFADSSREKMGLPDDSGYTILFMSHLDTVGPAEHGAVVVDGSIVRTNGKSVLGADDKAGVALMLGIAKLLAGKGAVSESLPRPPVLCFTGGEEIGLKGSSGLDTAIFGQRTFGIVLDSSRPIGHIIVAGPGYTEIEAEFTGKAAHAGSGPEKGIHAHQAAARAMLSVEIGRVGSVSTRNIIFASCEEATNIIPEKALLKCELRSLSESALRRMEQETRMAFREAAGKTGATLDFRSRQTFGPFRIPTEHPLVRLCADGMEKTGIQAEIVEHLGASDANSLNALGIPTVNLGLEIKDCHSTRESFDMKNLSILGRFISNILKEPRFGETGTDRE